MSFTPLVVNNQDGRDSKRKVKCIVKIMFRNLKDVPLTASLLSPEYSNN